MLKIRLFKIYRVGFMMIMLAFIMNARVALAQKIISIQVDNSREVSEGIIVANLNIEDAPIDFSLVVNNVITEGQYFNLLLRYEILSKNQIKFYLNNPPYELSNKALHVETNAGSFKIRVNLLPLVPSSLSGMFFGFHGKKLYDNVVVLPGYKARLQYIRPEEPTGKEVIEDLLGYGQAPYYASMPWPGGNEITFQINENISICRVFLLDDYSRIVTKEVNFRVVSPDEIAALGLKYDKASDLTGIDTYVISLVPKQQFLLEGGSWIWEIKEFGTSAWGKKSETNDTIKIRNPRDDFYIRRGYMFANRIVYSPELLVKVLDIKGGSISCAVSSVKPGTSVTINGSSLNYPSSFSFTYQWEQRKGSEVTWSEIPGATGKDYSSIVTENTRYRRKIISGRGVFHSNELTLRCKLSKSIQTTTYLAPVLTSSNTSKVVDIIYQDGFGRAIQEIEVNGIPANSGNGDIIIPRVYGRFGRVEKEYLPYAKAGNNGNFDLSAGNASNWTVLDNEDRNYAYSTITYDNSPFDRVVKQTGSGKNWQINNRGVTTTYSSNSANQVKILGVDTANGALSYPGVFYPVNTLTMIRVTDEDGGVTEKYQDREGNVLLSASVNAGNRQETYHVYDDRGLLRYILSPEASAGLTTNVSSSVLNLHAYYYEYDGCKRMTLKRLPGCEPEYMVYDKRDRLVMCQNGNQRSANAKKWSYMLHDDRNRVIETGEVLLTGDSTTHAALQTSASKKDNYIPPGSRTALQYTVYDSYPTSGNIIAKGFLSTGGYSSTYSTRVSGLKTVVKAKVLDENLTDKWLTTTIYYDDKARVIQTVSDNILGFTSRSDVKYDFTDKVLKVRETHGYVTTGTDVQEITSSYDDRGRLLSTTTVLNGGTPAVLEYQYDAIGRLNTRKYKTGTTFLAEALSYNTRGWLTGKESGVFKMKLRYDVPRVNTTARFNGNISEWEWQQGSGPVMLYTFTYDGIDRLTGNRHYQKSVSTWNELKDNNAFVEKNLQYDRNGNILSLTRSGSATTTLSYTYTGNQLASLLKNNIRGSYSYDGNGNMINDGRKNWNLSYNVLNLLSTVKTGTTLTTRFSYLADGTKLGVFDGGNNGFYYLGSLTYKKMGASLQLEGAMFAGGQILANVSNRVGSELRYFLTDHLGSVRVIVDQTGTVKERNDYYPFGCRYAVAGSGVDAGSRWKYNGKEEQTTGGLGYLDYGARMYDSEVGRWFGVDPLSENYYSWSSYNYCLDQPVRFVDPNGMWVDEWRVDPMGNITFFENDKRNRLYSVDKNGNETGSMFVNDRSILDQLYGNGLLRKKGDLSMAIGNENSQDEMLRTFFFIANNTDVEWRVDRYMENGKNNYSLGTLHDEGFSPSAEAMGHSTESTIAFIHSHPKVGITSKDELESMGWGFSLSGDAVYKAYNSSFANVNYYTYFPNSRRLWSVEKYRAPKPIRNRISSYKRFFFGTINTR